MLRAAIVIGAGTGSTDVHAPPPGGFMNPLSALTGEAGAGEWRLAAKVPMVTQAGSVLRRRRVDLHGQLVAQEVLLARAARPTRSDPQVATEAQVLVAQLTGTRLLLGQVDAALARITEGTYGRCTSCGEAISRARLDVMPYVRCCLRCHRSS